MKLRIGSWGILSGVAIFALGAALAFAALTVGGGWASGQPSLKRARPAGADPEGFHPLVVARKVRPASSKGRQTAPKPWHAGTTASIRARALHLFKRGSKFFGQSKHQEALTFYRSAIKLWDHPNIRYDMAVCYLHQNKPVLAFLSLRRALRFGKAPLGVDYQKAVGHYNYLKSTLAVIEVVCQEPGARVFLDGKSLFVGPGRAEQIVKAGSHVVAAIKNPSQSLARNVEARGGKTIAVELRFRRSLVGSKPTKAVQRTSRYHWWIPTAATVVTGVLLSIGAGLAVKGHSDVQDVNVDIERHRTLYGPSFPYSYDTGKANRGRGLQVAGYALIGVAGALAIGSLVLWLLRDRRSKDAETTALRF